MSSTAVFRDLRRLASRCQGLAVSPMSDSRWWVYMIRSRGGRLYTGITTDIERRFQQHSSGKGGARFFRSDPPEAVVYREAVANRSEASRREAEIKKLSAALKRELLS